MNKCDNCSHYNPKTVYCNFYLRGREKAINLCHYYIDAKREDTKDMDIIHKITTEIHEQTDEFIFTTIRPFCEGFTRSRLSKDDLRKALSLYMFAKPIFENEKGEKTGD